MKKNKKKKSKLYYKGKMFLSFLLIVSVGYGIPRILFAYSFEKDHTENDELISLNLKDDELAQAILKAYPDNDEVKQLLKNKNEYPKEILNLLLNNEETLAFVQNYPEYKNTSSSSITNQEANKKIAHFLQWDMRWGYSQYGDSIMALSGCGPTALSMVMTALTHTTKYDPYTIAKLCEHNGYYVNGVGSSWSMMEEVPAYFGIHSEALILNHNSIREALAQGAYIIVSVGAGDFSKTGHFIVIYDIDENDELSILDPNSIKRSNQKWKMERIMKQTNALWALS